jgi:hypothetical protein
MLKISSGVRDSNSGIHLNKARIREKEMCCFD